MTRTEIYRELSRGGPFALPYLVEFSHGDFGTIRVVNNNEDVSYGGHVYRASAFSYTRPKTVGGVLQNGSLEITAVGNRLIEFFDRTDYLMTVDVTGVLARGGEVVPMRIYHHRYGTVTIDNEMKIHVSFSNDDRLDMQFPPFVFDNDNNRGNA